jgi:uncharacterized protein HemX
MKNLIAVALLAVCSLATAIPASAQRTTPEENARRSSKAAKQQAKALKKANKKQAKAAKKYAKKQAKETKKANQQLQKRRG